MNLKEYYADPVNLEQLREKCRAARREERDDLWRGKLDRALVRFVENGTGINKMAEVLGVCTAACYTRMRDLGILEKYRDCRIARLKNEKAWWARGTITRLSRTTFAARTKPHSAP
jgi:hypothetical protein